jgi:hypothetical protein
MEAMIHHRAFLPAVPKSFCATSTTAQMVPKKNGTHKPTNITIVFKSTLSFPAVLQFLKSLSHNTCCDCNGK